jgi:hypothetical protein
LSSSRDHTATCDAIGAPAPRTPLRPAWHVARHYDLPAAIAEFKAALPGWWYSVCECERSCDASCAPTIESPDIDLIEVDDAFDSGFHADLPQPSSLADALLNVLAQALAAKADAARSAPQPSGNAIPRAEP